MQSLEVSQNKELFLFSTRLQVYPCRSSALIQIYISIKGLKEEVPRRISNEDIASMK